MVPTLQCGFVRSNFALAMDCPYSLHARPATWLRPCCPAALGFARPYRGLGAGEGNRTLVISLEGCCSTIELHPHRGRERPVRDLASVLRPALVWWGR